MQFRFFRRLRFGLVGGLLLLGGLLLAQGTPREITGTVSSQDEASLIGVTIRVEGKAAGAVTDLDGNYTVTAAPEDVLIYSYTGFTTQRITVGAQTVIDVQLAVSATDLAEVVVVGYGTQRRRDLTGAVASAPVEAFREAPNTNILQSLNGTVPGLSVGQSATAGEDAGFQIRGQNTLSGNSSVLVVVDGVIYRGRISDLNPNDIASVDVLKDASSKAIYGAQGANGVIMITTKRGRSARKPTIAYSGSFTTQNPTEDLTILDRDAYLQAVRAVDYEEAFLGPDFLQPNPDYDPVVNSQLFGPLIDGIQNGSDTDWLDLTRQDGFITDHQLSISGGGNNNSYFISGGYTEQQGIITNDNYQRFTTRVNLDVDLTDWLSVGTQSFATFADYSGDSPDIGDLTRMSPLARARDENGELIINPTGSNQVNPLLDASSQDRDLRNRLAALFYASVDIPFVKGLNYRVNYNHNYRFAVRQNANEFDGGLSGQAFKNDNRVYDWILDNILTYDVPLTSKHNLKLTALAGRNRIKQDNTSARGVGYSNLTLGFNDLSQAAQQFITSGAYEESFSYQMGRLAYDFDGKYLLTATVRRDGFSGFAENNRTAIFPSASLGWVVSEESFMADGFFDFLKMRFGYGASGNLTGRYSSLARISAGEGSRYVFGDGGQTINGQTVTTLANPNLTWERNEGINLGVDFGFLDGKLSGSIDYYRDNTTDLLFDLVLPTVTGFEGIRSNVGEVANRGLEFQLNFIAVETDRLRWDVGFNLARNRNEIVSLLGFDNDGDGREDDLVASGLFIGESIGTVFNYEVEGIYQLGDDIPDGYVPGSYRLRDVNGDGEISPDDRTILGRTEPAYQFGIRSALTYGNFTLRLFINSIQGGEDFYLGFNEALGVLTPGLAQSRNWYDQIDYWRPDNPNARYRLPGVDTPFDGNQYFQRSFVRLQDVSLAYNVPATSLERLGLGELKVFISGKNLLTLTDWEGWDPETSAGLNDARPLLGGYSFGVNVSF